jgi:hypothetical protein
MCHKHCFEALDRTLRDLMSTYDSHKKTFWGEDNSLRWRFQEKKHRGKSKKGVKISFFDQSGTINEHEGEPYVKDSTYYSIPRGRPGH